MSQYVIGVDVGGTNIRVGVVDSDLNVIKKTSIKTATITTFNEFVTALKTMIKEVDSGGLAHKIGIVLPTPWVNEMEVFRDATNVPFLEGVKVVQLREKFLEHDLYFENDVNVVALLEANIATRKDVKSLMYITVSTGIGSGIVIDGKVWQGAHGYAGEVGNMIVSCASSQATAILEDLCSGAALDAIAKQLYGQGATAETLLAAYKENESTAMQTMKAWFSTFSDALASVVHVVNPELIVFGGSVITNNECLLAELTGQTRVKLFENLRPHLRIELTHFSSDSGILGGAQLCISEI